MCDGTLHDLIENNKKSKELTFVELREKVLRQITDGVKHLHDNKIIHRDLKPSNILYCNNPSLVMKVADFGQSRILKEGASYHNRTIVKSGHSDGLGVFGTPGWIAPEVLNGEKCLRPSVDIYPLGLIFAYTLCEGKLPIENNKKMPLNIQNELKERGGENFFNLINRMICPEPSERPTAAQIIENKYLSPLLNARDPKVLISQHFCLISNLQ